MKQPRCLTRLLAAGVSLCLLCALPGCSGGQTGKAPGPTEEQLTAVREELVTKSHVKDLGGVNKMEFYEKMCIRDRYRPVFPRQYSSGEGPAGKGVSS